MEEIRKGRAARKARRAGGSGGNDNDEGKGGERGGAGNPGIEPLEIERDDQPMLNSKTGKSRRSLRQERNELRASREGVQASTGAVPGGVPGADGSGQGNGCGRAGADSFGAGANNSGGMDGGGTGQGGAGGGFDVFAAIDDPEYDLEPLVSSSRSTHAADNNIDRSQRSDGDGDSAAAAAAARTSSSRLLSGLWRGGGARPGQGEQQQGSSSSSSSSSSNSASNNGGRVGRPQDGAFSPVVWHPRRQPLLATAPRSSSNTDNRGGGGVEGEDGKGQEEEGASLLPIAVSPRLQELTIGQKNRSGSSGVRSWLGHLRPRGGGGGSGSSENKGDGDNDDEDEGGGGGSVWDSDRLCSFVLGGGDEWAEVGGQGVHKTTAQPAVQRLLASGAVKDRLVRDLVALVETAQKQHHEKCAAAEGKDGEGQQQKQSHSSSKKKKKQRGRGGEGKSSGDQKDDDDDGDAGSGSDDLDEEEKGEGKEGDRAEEKTSGSSKRRPSSSSTSFAVDPVVHLATLRARGYATLDDVLDGEGSLRGCEDPIVPHPMRVGKDVFEKGGGGTASNGGNSSSSSSNGNSGNDPEGGGIGSGGSDAGGGVGVGLLRQRQGPRTVVRTPTTGVGPSVVASSFSGGGDGPGGGGGDGSGGGGAELVVALSKVAIYDHPLFSPEERLAALLRSAHSQYASELERDPCRYYCLRLDAAVKELEHVCGLLLSASSSSSSSAPTTGSAGSGDKAGGESGESGSMSSEAELMAKLLARAYPDTAQTLLTSHPPPSAGAGAASSHGAGGAGGGGSGGGSVPPAMSLEARAAACWSDACETLSLLMDAEMSARQTTKRVYRLWRALEKSRVAAARDANDASGLDDKTTAATSAPTSSSSPASWTTKTDTATTGASAADSQSASSRFSLLKKASSLASSSAASFSGSGQKQGKRRPRNRQRGSLPFGLGGNLGGGGGSGGTGGAFSGPVFYERVCVTPMKLKLVERPPKALQEQRLEALPSVQKLAALHPKLVRMAMGAISSAWREQEDRRKGSGSGGGSCSGGREEQGNTVNSAMQQEKNSKEQGGEDGGDENAELGGAHEDGAYMEARAAAKERHQTLERLYATALAFFKGAGDGGVDTAGAAGLEEEEKRGKKARGKGGRGKRDDNEDDDDGGDGKTGGLWSNGAALGVGAGRFRYLLKLSLDGEKTPSTRLPPAEKHRRRRLNACRFYAVLCVNEDDAGSGGGGASGHKRRGGGRSDPKGAIRIPARGSVPFSDVDLKTVAFRDRGEVVRLKVLHKPHSLVLRIYAVGGGHGGVRGAAAENAAFNGYRGLVGRGLSTTAASAADAKRRNCCGGGGGGGGCCFCFCCCSASAFAAASFAPCGGDSLVASVPVPLPGSGSAFVGASAAALSRDAAWFEFSAALVMPPKRGLSPWASASAAVVRASRRFGHVSACVLALSCGQCGVAAQFAKERAAAREREEREEEEGVDGLEEDKEEEDKDGKKRGKAASEKATSKDKKAKRRGNASNGGGGGSHGLLLGNKRKERTAVEDSLWLKYLPASQDRRTHGVCLVSTQWALKAGGGGCGCGSGGGGGGAVLRLPEEKARLEQGMLVGRLPRQRRPWEQSNDPDVRPTPLFARDGGTSGFLRTLPRWGTADPFDPGEGHLRRYFGKEPGGPDSPWSYAQHPVISQNFTKTLYGFGGQGGGAAGGGVVVSEGRKFTPAKADVMVAFSAPAASSSSSSSQSSHHYHLPPLRPRGGGGGGKGIASCAGSAAGGGGGGSGPILHALSNRLVFKEPARHTLLKARQRRPDATAFVGIPVPLSNEDVERSEGYKVFLMREAALLDANPSLQEQQQRQEDSFGGGGGGGDEDPDSSSLLNYSGVVDGGSSGGGGLVGGTGALDLTRGLDWGETSDLLSLGGMQLDGLSSLVDAAGGGGGGRRGMQQQRGGGGGGGGSRRHDAAASAAQRAARVDTFARRVRESRLAMKHRRGRKGRRGGVGGSINNQQPRHLDAIVRRMVFEDDFDPMVFLDIDAFLPSPYRRLRPSGAHGRSPAALAAAAALASVAGATTSTTGSGGSPNGEHNGGGSGGEAALAARPHTLIVRVLQGENVPVRKSPVVSNRGGDGQQLLPGLMSPAGGRGGMNSSRDGPIGRRSSLDAAASGSGLGGGSPTAAARRRRNDGGYGGGGGNDPSLSLLASFEADDEDDLNPEVTMQAMRVESSVSASLLRGRELLTLPVAGQNPHWRETLVLRLDDADFGAAGGDSDSGGGAGGGSGAGLALAHPGLSLGSDGSKMVIALFDHVETMPPPTNMAASWSESQHHQQQRGRVERRYLGSVSVPLSTIALSGRVEGYFRLDTPEVNLAYEHSVGGLGGGDRGSTAGTAAAVAAAAAGVGVAGVSANRNDPFGMLGSGGGSFFEQGASWLGGGGNTGLGNADAMVRSSSANSAHHQRAEAQALALHPAPGDFSPDARRHRELTSTFLRLSCVLDPPPFGAGGGGSADGSGAGGGGGAVAGNSDLGGSGGGGEGSGAASSLEVLAHLDAENSEESEMLLLRARQWVGDLKKLAHQGKVPKDRVFEATATSLEGMLVFLPRFLRPGGIEPPPKNFFPRGDGDGAGGGGGGNNNGSSFSADESGKVTGGRSRRNRRNGGGGGAKSNDNDGGVRCGGGNDDESYDPVAEAARFVALVPFLEDFRAFRDLDLWCTSSQFLEVLAGDYEEHAILLWHYLVWLQAHGHMSPRSQGGQGEGGEHRNNSRWTFYLALGRGIPEGSTVLVLQYDSVSGDAVLWDACAGEALDARDPRLGLVDVGCLFGPDNIWANLQQEGKPADMVRRGKGFDVNDSRKWRPFFSNPPPPTAVVSSPSSYSSSSSSNTAAAAASALSSHFSPSAKRKSAAFTTTAGAAAAGRREVLMAGQMGSVQLGRLAYAPPLEEQECQDLAQRIQDRLRDAITLWRTSDAAANAAAAAASSFASSAGGSSVGGLYGGAGGGGADHRAYPVFAPDTRAKILLRQLEPRKLGQRSLSLSSSAQAAAGGGGGGGVSSSGSFASSMSGLGHSIGELRSDNSQRDVFGVTLNFTFTDMETIEERLKSTAIHETTAPDVLFLLAVHVVPFPCKVLSVWVFYGSMPRKTY